MDWIHLKLNNVTGKIRSIINLLRQL